MRTHWQHDGRWFVAWFGFALRRWMCGVVFNVEDGWNLGIGLGPFYVGVGGYDR